MDPENARNISDLLVKHILGGHAYIKTEEILTRIAYEKTGQKIPGLPYTFWQLFEHLRIAQKDILDFSSTSDYRELKWPDDYWPDNPAPDSPEQWNLSKEQFFTDRNKFTALLASNSDQLLTPFSYGSGQSLLREALLILEHNAYHSGQLVILARLLDSE